MKTTAHLRSLGVTALLLAASCGTVSTGQYRSMTSGVIGCPAEEITISDAKNVVWGGQGIGWRAECRGHRFICSYAGSAACKEELGQAPSAAPAVPPAGAPAQAPRP